jgi:methyl-accepting chemotaxis protein
MTQPAGAPPPPPTGFGWVDAAVRVVTQVGFPVVAAGVLLYFVLFRFTDQVSAVANQLSANAAAVDRVTTLHAAELDELKKQTGTLDRQAAALEEIVQRMRQKAEARP